MGTVDLFAIAHNPIKTQYTQLVTRFDPEHGVLWTEMNQEGIPCMTEKILDELTHHQTCIEKCGGVIQLDDQLYPIRYVVAASLIPGAFNLGGNLSLFSALIKNKDRKGLIDYSIKCLDVMYSRMSHFGLPLITISLVQGDALGGGLEAALASDVIIAERSAKMGFPEILFNLIPGHGAFSLVARKIGVTLAEDMILGGKLYSAEELFELGLVDVLVEDGMGEEAVYEFVEKQARKSNGYMALKKTKHRFDPVTYQEMLDITNIWADAALQLTEKDLKVMDRFLRSQQKLFEKGEEKVQTGSDRQVPVLASA